MRSNFDRKVQAAFFADWIMDMKPDAFISLLLNNGAWRGRDRGGKMVSMDWAAKSIMRVALAVDKIALGRQALHHNDDRMFLIAFPEKPNDFLHYHGFVWYPNVQDIHRDLTFPWHWFERAWKQQWQKAVPGGTVDIQSLHDRPGQEPVYRASRYAFKEAHYGHALDNYVISPAGGALPLPARLALRRKRHAETAG